MADEEENKRKLEKREVLVQSRLVGGWSGWRRYDRLGTFSA